ncbi:MAG: helix-turn-helix domain-containing protein [Clostridiales bacterium]|nr:helix-turn-helix domain-containing protein [Clostridiales bacterium]
MRFHENLMQLRREKGLSQEELGYELNVTRQTVSKWELGQTTPEMDKLMELSRFFELSMDELVGNAPRAESVAVYPRAYHYEYKSERTLWGLPLVHVNIGIGIRKAKGILAIGTVAKGIFAIGAVSVGMVSIGAVSVGLLAIGALAAGIFALGGFSLGAFAIGGIAVGLLALGGVAAGMYAVGGFASAARVAMGGFAQGHIAIGEAAKGEYAWQKIAELTSADYAEIRSTILREYPRIWAWLLHIFVS